MGCVIYTFKKLRALCQSREPWKVVRLRFISVVAFYVTSFIAFKYYYPSWKLKIDTMVDLFDFLILLATSGEITEEEEEEDELKKNDAEL